MQYVPRLPCPLLAGHILHWLPESLAGLNFGCPQRSPSQLHALDGHPFPFCLFPLPPFFSSLSKKNSCTQILVSESVYGVTQTKVLSLFY